MPSHRQRAARNGQKVFFAFQPEGYSMPLFRVEQRVFPSTTVNGIVAALKGHKILHPSWAPLIAACPCQEMLVPLDTAIPPEACCTITVIMSGPRENPSESETEALPTEAPEPEAEASSSEDEQVNLSALQ